MRLVVVTPHAVAVDCDAASIRAEDESGSFGILDGHAALLTALTVSVLVYRERNGPERFVAVRGGLLTVTAGRRVEVLTREAVLGDELETLRRDVLGRFRKASMEEERTRAGVRRLGIALAKRVAELTDLEKRG
jgi:F-type H+-transporting ATPase subunit epsilon